MMSPRHRQDSLPLQGDPLAPALNPGGSASDSALSGAFRAEGRRSVARRWQRRLLGATFAARHLQTDAGATP